MTFLQLADGVDDEAWTYHLGRGDYSAWFRDAIKDEEPATEASAIEARRTDDPQKTRAQIRAAV